MISKRTLNTFRDYLVSSLSWEEIERLFDDNDFMANPFSLPNNKRDLYESYQLSFIDCTNESKKLDLIMEGIEKIYKANDIVAYGEGHAGEFRKNKILNLLKSDGYDLINNKLVKVVKNIATIKVSSVNQLMNNYEEIKKHDKVSSEKKIGLAKDLLESLYKTICDNSNIIYEENEKFDSLTKKALSNLDIIKLECTEKEKSHEYIMTMIRTVSLKINEVRNIHGYGHGRNSAYKPIDIEVAELIANLAISIATFLIPKLNKNIN